MPAPRGAPAVARPLEETLDTITREQKLYAIAAGNLLWVISLFFSWYSFDVPGGGALGVDTSISGWDSLPSSWLFLAIGVIGGLAALAEAREFELPMGLPAVPLAGWATSVLLIVSLAYLFEGDAAWGLFLAVVFALVAAAATVLVWREDH